MTEAHRASQPGGVPDGHDPFADGAIARVVQTTEPQREIWLATRLGDAASLAYNLSVSLRFLGALDVPALRAALNDVVARHDALRCTFGPDGETLVVQDRLHIDLPLRDLAAGGASAAEAALEQASRDAVSTPFALEHGPLLRAELLRLAGDRHVLLLTAHHIVCDGWSFGVAKRELARRYAERVGDATAEPLPAAPSFADYAVECTAYERSAQCAADVQYWRGLYERPVVPLDLPLDRARAPRRSFNAACHVHTPQAGFVEALKRCGGRHGAGLFAVLLSGTAALLGRLCRQDEVVVGIASAGQAIDDRAGLVGHAVNLLPLRLALPADASFADLMTATQSQLYDATEHQRLTFGSLLRTLRVERDPSRLPLVNVVFNLDQATPDGELRFPGLQVRQQSIPRSHDNFELILNAVQGNGPLRIEAHYNTDLFDAGTVVAWMQAFESLLLAAAAAPQSALARLPLVGPAALEALAALQPPRTRNEPGVLAHEFFERQVDRAPTRSALRVGDQALDYAGLEARANRIAHLLRAKGVARGARVGIAVDRSSDMVASVLGVLKSGAAYVPLDPAFPVARLNMISADAELTAVLTQSVYRDRIAFGPTLVLCLDELAAELAACPTERLARAELSARPEDTAFVIYTSGSTGKPKGVQVHHGACANFIASVRVAPGMHEDDRLVGVTTLSFDIAFMEMMLPLASGAELILADREQQLDGNALRSLIERSGATFMQATPTGWRLLLDSGWQGSSRFRAVTGGEPLSLVLAEALLARCCEVWNGYGPTETTVYSTLWRVTDPASGIYVGRPIRNTQVWALDEHRQPCPLGVPGELWIGGEGVSLGYHRRPELTAERFIADPYSSAPGARLYGTGDRGRWLANGQLQVQGRLDFQVKVRGHRIELGEIESQLAAHPQVARAVVVTHEFAAGDVRIVAYVVTRAAGITRDALNETLREHLSASLPAYMLPQHFVQLEAIPTLPNGKVDRRALPSPQGQPASLSSATDRGGAPASATERAVAAIWSELLGTADVRRGDNFFMLGGHSLLMMQLIVKLRGALGLAVPLRAILNAPDLAALAATLDVLAGTATKTRQPAGTISPRDRASSSALSVMQQRLWFMEHLQPGLSTYNISWAARLFGRLDVPALERATQALLERHPLLRSQIRPNGDKPARLHLQTQAMPVRLEFEDLTSAAETATETERDRLLQARLEAFARTPLQVVGGALSQWHVVRVGEDEHLLLIKVHHTVFDGWSLTVVLRDLERLYEAERAAQHTEIEALSLTYGDFVQWHTEWLLSDDAREQVAYWTARLRGLGEPLALPNDHRRPARPSNRSASVSLTLPVVTVQALRALAAEEAATLFIAALAGYFVWLHKHTGQTDLVVGMPVHGRDRPELAGVVGLFANTLAVRFEVRPKESFRRMVKRLRETLHHDLGHPDAPFERVLRELQLPRDESRFPVYQTLFAFEDVRQRSQTWGGLRLAPFDLPSSGIAEDLACWMVEHASGLSARLTYSCDLFEPASAEAFSQRLRHVFERVVAVPDAAIESISMASDAERLQLQAWAGTQVPAAAQPNACSLFEAQVRLTPARTAVVFGELRLSYGELALRVQQLAGALRRRGIGRGARVGVLLGRGPDLLATLLAVMKAGAAYVPMDPLYPAERLAYMADDAELALVVTHSAISAEAAWLGARAWSIDGPDANATGLETTETTESGNGAVEAQGDDAAYVIYTSGSTGKPKGVAVPHRAVVNFLTSMAREPGLVADDVLVAVTTPSFDIAVLELLLPLSVGAQVVMASAEQVQDGRALRQLLERSRATVMQATPSSWRMLLEAGWRGAPDFKALVGGEALPEALAQQVLARSGELWNMYGPTETTVWSTCWKVEAPERGVFVGRPIANTRIHVLDARREACAIGVAGEIYIAGSGVALGYLGRAELTAERFLAEPGEPGARMYRSGDLGRWRHDGHLEHLGRLDAQLKLRGFRIEPGEIEHRLAGHPGVVSALVVVREDRKDDARLVAYVVPRAEMPPAAELREHLRQSLPEHMLPQHYVALSALPLLPNGKTDRAALPQPSSEARLGTGLQDPPRSPAEVAIAAIWQRLLNVSPVSVTDNFFDLGGHSMLAMQAVGEMQTALGRTINLRRLVFESLEQLAVGEAGPNNAAEPPPRAVQTSGLFGRLKGVFGVSRKSDRIADSSR